MFVCTMRSLLRLTFAAIFKQVLASPSWRIFFSFTLFSFSSPSSYLHRLDTNSSSHPPSSRPRSPGTAYTSPRPCRQSSFTPARPGL
ncbi:hypothetical protein C8J57DRAFT_1273800, partial [Mycena rebaudengoi]